jgi:GNAT superfamily N-acetyltransferase
MPTARLTDFFAKRLRDDHDAEDVIKKKKKKNIAKDSTVEPMTPVKEQKQMYLDLGQKPHITCKGCGMCYDPSFKADTQKHSKHHAKFLQSRAGADLKLPGKTAPIFAEPFKMAGLTLKVCTPESKAIQRVAERINDECMAAAPLDFEAKFDYKAYFVVDGTSAIVAFALAEPIQEAFRSRPHTDPAMVCDLLEGGVPASIGISRIWVAPRMRSRGLGKQVLEAVRETFAKPVVASKAMLAFSQPTQQGYQLARAYLRVDETEDETNVLVYK